MATEYVCAIKTGGVPGTDCDYVTQSAWRTAHIVNPYSLNAGNFPHAQWRVYSHGGITGTVADGNVVIGQTNSYTATVVHATATQILVVHDAAGETFANSEELRVSVGNSVTVTAGGGTGDTASPIIALDGEVEDALGIAISGIITSSANKVIVRPKGATAPARLHPHDVALRYGAGVGRYKYTGTSTGNALAIQEDYVDIEDIDIERLDTSASAAVVSINGQSASNSISLRRLVVLGECASGGHPIQVNDADAVVYIDNVVCYSATAHRILQVDAGTVHARFCTFFGTRAAGCGAIQAAASASAVVDATDCYGNQTSTLYAFACGTGGTLTLNHCATNAVDTGYAVTGCTWNGTDELAAASQFTSVTGGSEDFRLLGTAGVINVGVAIAGLTTDIFNHTRPDGFEDIGVAELLAGGASITATGGITFGALAIAGTVETTPAGTVNVTGSIIFGALQVGGAILMAPTDIHVDGSNNPTGVVTLTPNLSALCSKLSGNITHVQVQVSAIDDDTFTQALSYDSGLHLLTTPLAVEGRCEEIPYGHGV